MDIANDVLADLKSKGVEFNPAFIVLVGSMTGLQWDASSDLDLHIGIDFSEFPVEEVTFIKNLLVYYARVFNNQKYTIKGRNVELYFQDSNEKNETPGMYDLKNAFWIKIPDQTPKIFNSKVKTAAGSFLRDVEVLIFEWDNISRTHEDIKAFIEKVNGLMKQITEMRKQSLLHDGLYGFGNQVFRELRRNGTLPKLSSLRLEAQEAWYDVEEGKSSKARDFLNLVEQGTLDLEFKTDGDMVGPEYQGYVAAVDKVTGKQIGYVDYTKFGGVVYIKMIEVEPEYQRKGIATKLLDRLKIEFPNKPVKAFGDYATQAGQELVKNYGIEFEEE